MRHSILELAMVPEGGDAARAIANAVDLAQHAERWGYHRFWLAEHHNTPGNASAATAVLVGHVAGATRHIRVGAGGIMLPNHAPLAIAEQFGTLATIHPGRIDLGLGRAPGGDSAVARAFRRFGADDSFAQDVVDLMGLLGPADPDARLAAHPGQGTEVPITILGSSLFGAQLAAQLGLPYAFASHFAPDALREAFDLYRRTFRPSARLARPHAMMAVNVFAAPTEAEAHRLRTSLQLGFARLMSGARELFPAPVDDITSAVAPQLLATVNARLRITAIGTPAQVRDQMAALIARHVPDEVILTAPIHDHAARLRSFALAAQAMGDLGSAAAA